MTTGLIEILLDGGSGLGYGHISRMRTLARTLRAEGWTVRFNPLSGVAREALSDLIDPEAIGEASLTLIDLPYDATDYVRRAKAAGRPVVALDYIGHEEVDLALRTNAPAEPVPARRELHGLRYALIRKEIRDAEPEAGEHVLIVVGGSDLGDRGVEAARHLARKDERVILVRGPLAAPLEAVAEGVDVRINPGDLPALMAGCAWAVANAGTSLMELMSLGKAVHVLPQTREEERFAADLKSQGAILGIGLDMLAPPSPERQAQTALKAASLIDGKGAERIVELCAWLIAARSGRIPAGEG